MKIGIIGYGFVGRAIGHAHKDDELIIIDPYLEDTSASYADLIGCSAIYVCVPSPSTSTGHCNTSILEDVLSKLLFATIAVQIPIICKTTAPPSAYGKLLEKYPNIVHCPEFLTAARADFDYAMAKYFVIGGYNHWCQAAIEVMTRSNIETDNFLQTDIKTAALYKYLMNSYLATKVTFMNEFYELAKEVDANWEDMLECIKYDTRVGNTHLSVPGPDGQFGWGGACFPKDVAAICEEALDHKVEFELLQRVETINKRHRRKDDEPV